MKVITKTPEQIKLLQFKNMELLFDTFANGGSNPSRGRDSSVYDLIHQMDLNMLTHFDELKGRNISLFMWKERVLGRENPMIQHAIPLHRKYSFGPIASVYGIDPEFTRAYRQMTHSSGHETPSLQKSVRNEHLIENTLLGTIRPDTVFLSGDDLWYITPGCMIDNRGDGRKRREDTNNFYNAVTSFARRHINILNKTFMTYYSHNRNGLPSSLYTKENLEIEPIIESYVPRFQQLRRNGNVDVIAIENINTVPFRSNEYARLGSESKTMVIDKNRIIDGERDIALYQVEDKLRSIYQYQTSILGEGIRLKEVESRHGLEQIYPSYMETDFYLGKTASISRFYQAEYLMDCNKYKLLNKYTTYLALKLNTYQNITESIVNDMIEAGAIEIIEIKGQQLNELDLPMSLYMIRKVIRTDQLDAFNDAIRKHMNVVPMKVEAR